MDRQLYDHRPAASAASGANSQMISKPKIRIVHVFAPPIIKTDAENFRELVQRLTGKPTERRNTGRRKKKAVAPAATLQYSTEEEADHGCINFKALATGLNVKRPAGEMIVEEQMMMNRGLWMEEDMISSGDPNFLSTLGDNIDVFFNGSGDHGHDELLLSTSFSNYMDRYFG